MADQQSNHTDIEMVDQQSNHTDTTEREALERLLSDANAEPIQISYQFVKSITKNFSEVIGRGGFGEVYLGFHRNEKKVAVKKIFGSQDFSDKPFLDEINCLMMVKHKNIVRFLAYCAETKEQLIKHEGRFILADVRQRFLCFEYVPNGNLDAYLKDNCRGDDWQTRYQMVTGVCHGLNYLHQKRINHLDLKPENILLDALLEPKITDFGVSRFLSEGRSRIITKSIVGTFGYIAPEILQNGEISFKADVYSLGSIIIKLLTGHDKYDYKNWHKSLDTENSQLKSCMEIARNCRHDDQHKRPSISEIICQLKDMESITENGSSVNHELSHGRQLSSIYQADYWRESSLKMFFMETNTEQAPGNAQVIPNQNNPGQASADNTTQIGHAGIGDWQEEIHQMAQVPKVKLGDKITALQQIVSPFGKTDTASVLCEAIHYIKFLHEQVQLLSDPYMKSSSSKDYNPWGGLDRKEKAEAEADLRSRGLCLVPVSCTPQVYRDSNGPDYWTPPYRSCLYR